MAALHAAMPANPNPNALHAGLGAAQSASASHTSTHPASLAYQGAPSLADLKSQFEQRRLEQAAKFQTMLMQIA